MEWWSGLLEWSTGLDYWRGVAPLYACAMLLSVSVENLVGPRRCAGVRLHLLESAMTCDSPRQMETENDPIVILDSSPACDVSHSDRLPRSLVKILDGDRYRWAGA